MKHLLTFFSALVILFTASGFAHALTTTGWMEYPSNPVYSPGKAYYPSVLKEEGTYRMWSDCASGVQMATSPDGISWTTIGTVSGLLNPRHTVVEKVGSQYRIWYDEGSDAYLYSIEAIRTATSSDGLTWTNDQPITQVGTTVVTGTWPSWNKGSYGPSDVLYNPAGSNTIIEPVDKASVWANKFVMYYDGTTGNDEFLGLAVSNDGINWHGYNNGVAPVLDSTDGAWDSGYVAFGTVIRESDNLFHLWYSGGSDYSLNNGIGYASSSDGINWIKDADNPIFHRDDGVAWRDNRTYTPMVIGDQMWFSGKDAETGVYAIGYATPFCTPVNIVSLTDEFGDAGPLVVPLGPVVFEAEIIDGCGKIDAEWDFEEGTGDNQYQNNVADPVTATHTYTTAGVYITTLIVSDTVLTPADMAWIHVVVYDPSAGFVTGGGTIWSEAGYYKWNMNAEGRAKFSFVSKYNKGKNVPDGNTDFVFDAGDLHFHSYSYEWLVVTGSDYARFKGWGSINGEEGYHFMLWAGDDFVDTFRIKIWEEDEVSGDELVVYDNGMDQEISSGSIVIHTINK